MYLNFDVAEEGQLFNRFANISRPVGMVEALVEGTEFSNGSRYSYGVVIVATIYSPEPPSSFSPHGRYLYAVPVDHRKYSKIVRMLAWWRTTSVVAITQSEYRELVNGLDCISSVDIYGTRGPYGLGSTA